MNEEIRVWKEKALDFLLEFDSLEQLSNLEQYRSDTVLKLKKHAGCDDIYLLHKIDNVAETILVSTQPEFKDTFTDTSFLSEALPGKNFIFHEKANMPNRFHFLNKSNSIIYIPLAEMHYRGAIVMSWDAPFVLSEGNKIFLEICIKRIREVMRLNFAYFSLEELSVKFDTVFHTVTQSLIFTDDMGKDAWLNTQAKKMLGISAGDRELAPGLVADGMRNLREKAENASEIAMEAADLFNKPEKGITNWLWKYKDKVFKVSTTSTISKQVKGRLWVFEDISDIYFAKEKLEEANEEITATLSQISDQNQMISQQNEEIQAKNRLLEAINEEKNDLIGIVSHDLRAPLNNILGLVNIMEMQGKGANEKQKIFIDKIKSTLHDGLQLIKDILDIGAIEQQAVNKRLETLNVKEVLADQLPAFRLGAGKKQITIHLVDESAEHIILADKVFFQRIIENLVSNAIKFSFSGTSVYLTLKNDQDKLAIDIRDEGQGMKENDKEHLFQKFKKLSARPTANESSTGLGLSIVKRLVEELDGSIYCESEWGKGTTFTLEFFLYRNNGG